MATGNEDLFSQGGNTDANNYNLPSGYQTGHWGGDKGEYRFDPETGQYVPVRQTGVQQDVGRYQGQGQAVADRSAYQGNYADFNDAGAGFTYGQGRARGAMDLQQQAAEGRAPSAAEIAGRSAIDQSLTAQQSAAASTRGGPLAQAAAAREARQGAGAFRQSAVASIMAGRANEMDRARNAYAGSTFQYGQNQMGQQNLQLGKTQQQIQAEQFQRQLNQQGQQFYENKAFDTKSQGLAADFARSGQQFQSLQAERANTMAERQQDFNEFKGTVDSASNMTGSIAKGSDERMKNVYSDTRAKLPVTRNPYGEESIDLDDDVSFDDDDQKREHDRLADSIDIYRGDPYDDKSNAMLDDRERQNGAAPAHWLEEVVAQDNRDAAPKMQSPTTPTAPDGHNQFMYSYAVPSDARTKDLFAKGQISKEEYDRRAAAYRGRQWDAQGETSVSPRKLETSSSPTKKKDPTKADFDQTPEKEAPDSPTRTANSTQTRGARETAVEGKKIRRTIQDKASRDADEMMAGYKASVDQGPAVRRAEGGTPESGYETTLTAGAEESFGKNRKRLYGDDTGEDYDLRGAYAAGQTRDGRGHMTDQFKKPNHPTFSNESQYAEHGTPGHWDKNVPEKFVYSDPATKVIQKVRGFFGQPKSPPQEMEYSRNRDRERNARGDSDGSVGGTASVEDMREKSRNNTGLEDEKLIYSDENAKKKAFEDGVKLGQMKPEKVDAPNPYPVSPDSKKQEVARAAAVNEDNRRQAALNAAAVTGAAFGPIAGAGTYLQAQNAKPNNLVPSDERTKTDAAHALEGQDYTYKDEYLPPEQGKGEMNHGPMAQKMEKNRLTKTAVKKDKEGMRLVDMTKLTKVHSSLIDHLQDQIDELKGIA